MGLYITLNEKERSKRSQIGLAILKSLIHVFKVKKVFEVESCTIWKGYPLKSTGKIIEDKKVIEEVMYKDIYYAEFDVERRRITYRHFFTVKIRGYFNFEVENEQKEIPGEIILSGDATSKDLPDIYIETFAFYGKHFTDFLSGKKNRNRDKIFSCLNWLYKQKITGLNKAEVIIGVNTKAIDVMHKARYLRVQSVPHLLQKFVKYLYILKSEEQIDWIEVEREEIIGMYNRLSYLRKDFLPRAAETIMIREREKQETLSFYIRNISAVHVNMYPGSIILSDKDFSGRSMLKLLNDLLKMFSETINDVFQDRDIVEKELTKKFETVIKKML
jgi:hypothetical protein